VNSLGVGGTNAHAILEQAPEAPPADDSDWPFQLLVLSARSRTALDAASQRLAAHLRANPGQPLADVAFTLKEGRRAFEKRRVLVAATHAEAADLLEGADPRRVFTHDALPEPPRVAFLFPGGGAQHIHMARDLYETEPVFRDWMDRGLDHLAGRTDHDLRAAWLPEPGAEAAAADLLKRPSVQLPLIMIAEYALAQLWMAWGVQPAALIGHSMGENVAACLAGVLSFEECVDLVHLRGRLFDSVPAAGMLSIPLPEAEVRARIGAGLDMASVNAPDLCVVSGPDAALAALAEGLAAEGIETQRIAIDIAAHSRMLEPVLAAFGSFLRGLRLSPPRLPVISNRTGLPLTDAEATDPDYWVGHLRNTVQFAAGIAHLAADPATVFLEVGPGRALSSLAQANGVPANRVIPSLRHPDQRVADDAFFVATLGRLWALGVPVDWAPLWGEARRRRVPLPTYPFQRQPYFIAPGKGAADADAEAAEAEPQRIADPAAWGWREHWRPRAAPCEIDVDTELAEAPGATWLVFADAAGLADRAVERLRAAGRRVIVVRPGDRFARRGEDGYALSPERGRDDYDRLIADLMARGLAPDRIAHFWLVTADEGFRPGSSFFHRVQEQGFYSLLFLAQAMAAENLPRPIHLTVVTNGAAQVRAEALPHPAKATALGPARVLPREVPGITCATLDIDLPVSRRGARAVGDALVRAVLDEMCAEPGNRAAALRAGRRYARGHRPQPLPDPAAAGVPEGATWLITGGFGGIGLAMAERLARVHRARLVLLGRTPLPPRDTWDAVLRRAAPQDATAQRIAAVRRLEAAGAVVHAAAADVCNLQEMRAALAAAEAALGPVRAVIHAAGVIDDAPMLAKGGAAVEAVLAPKLHGTQVLDALFPDGRLDLLVLCSSTSIITAPAGQADYVAANAFLDAVARQRAGGRTRVLAINWGVWAEAGMAAGAVAERLGLAPPAPQVPAGMPLLDTATFDAAGNRLFTAAWRTADRWVLDGHRTAAGAALLPGTGVLELAAEALRAQGEDGAFEIRDLYFFRPLAVPDGATRAVRLRLARDPAGYRLDLRSDAVEGGRAGYQLNAEAVLALGAFAPPPPIDPAAIAARCTLRRDADPAGLRSPQEAHLRFGPRWRVLRRLSLGTAEGIAELALPEPFAGEPAQGWLMHPALLDLATGWAMELIAGYRPDRLWVPVSYARVRVYAPLPARLVSWVRNAGDNRADGPSARFDITLATPEGRVLVEIEGFAIRRLDGPLTLAQPPAAGELEYPDTPGAPARPLSAAEDRLRRAVAAGIPPAEGAAALDRALATGLPAVVVSSLDLPALIRQAEAAPPDAPGEGQRFNRPDLDSAYLAPRTDIERALAGFWEDLLGVDRVGVEDDFFALGGHSLIAVRLFAMIRKTWATDFPISVLFEAPTVARCAALIAERLGVPADGAGDGAAPAPRPARRFTHLVAMHEGEGGPRTPFFLVAGMFGNVLNLRHLAQLIGADRPLYGLQARGLFGDAPPHDTLDAAAADYIAEMRQIQSAGPYLVGGFSGGGLTAWEIARQLRAAGEGVAGVVLLDTPLPVRPALGRRDRLLIRLAELRAEGPGFLTRWARDRIAWEVARRRPRDDEAPDAFHDTAIEAAFRAALPRYRLAPLPVPVALFRPPLDRRFAVSGGRFVSTAREYVWPDNQWGPFAPALSVHEVPGDHDSMVLEPNVRVLAARLRDWLDAAEAGAHGAGAHGAGAAPDRAAAAARRAAE
jgi:acyl transferase domain-containing protein/thioesterase domain-containing protein